MGNKKWPCSRCIQINRFHTVMIITSYFCTCDTNSLQLFPSLCKALTELISPRQSSHHMGVKLLHTGPLILLPTDCQHVLMPTEPHSSLGPDCFTLWLYSTSTWRCFFFVFFPPAVGWHKGVSRSHAYNSQTSSDERLWLPSPQLSVRHQTHRQPQALHDGEALLWTSGIQQAEGTLSAGMNMGLIDET